MRRPWEGSAEGRELMQRVVVPVDAFWSRPPQHQLSHCSLVNVRMFNVVNTQLRPLCASSRWVRAYP